jgi:cellulose synthase/poly-beta-1,6-N-acetylglucosamine synthase-like glycosyltransferase
MEALVSGALTVVAGFISIPVIVICTEIVAAIALSTRPSVVPLRREGRRRVAVLLPAHNESVGLLPTVADIKSQLQPDERLLVVADNCTDDTAAIALAAGAEVIERLDPARIGKGYALDFGIRHLALSPPDIVVVIDADCRLGVGAIDELAAACTRTSRPVQSLYLMTIPEKSLINHQVAQFAWRVKNWIRPLGLKALGLPCQLMGTGMAMSWSVVRSVNLANGSIVEDLRLGLDLAQAGYPPFFCPSARVTSEFASSAKGAKIQRERWEQGHIQTILIAAPRLAWRGISQRNGGLVALALDLAVPPLSLLAILVIGTFLVASLTALFGLPSAAIPISVADVSALMLTIFFAWLKCGRDVLPAKAALSIVPYVFGKLSVYGRILSQRLDARWIKTDRTKSE